MKRSQLLLVLCGCALLLASCKDGENLLDPKKNDLIDPEAGLSREDFNRMRDVDGGKGNGSLNALEPPIPDLAEVLAAPKPPKIGETQLVSIAVTDDVPLKDVLIELARLADVDIEVDAGITGGIAFRAKERPFNEVIERIANLAGLRYNMKNNVLRVERDLPYVQIYTLDLLNVDRSSSGNIDVNTTAGSGAGGGGGSSGGDSGGGGGGGVASASVNSGSGTSITASAKSDFWSKFEDGMKQILAYQPASLASGASIASQTAGASAPLANMLAPDSPDAAAASSSAASSAGGFYILNRQAGTLTVSATQRQHEILSEFIRKIQANVSSQVLIEAKIVEVALSDRYQGGINWTQLGADNVVFSGNFGQILKSDGAAATEQFGQLNVVKNDILRTGIDLNGALKLAESFGTVRALSSPRLHAVNNQQAVLTFAQNYVYFELKVEITDPTSGNSATPGKTTVESTIKTVPIGIILSLLPSINTETNEITLSVRPTLSRVVTTVEDPAIAYVVAAASTPINIKSSIPVVEVRELDSILKLKSGQVMVIGGLMQDRTDNTDTGVPGLGEVPYLGNLFKHVDKNKSKSELVIFIRATIVDSNGNVQQSDKALYQKFMQDPNPLKF